jgi:hypothetical protein
MRSRLRPDCGLRCRCGGPGVCTLRAGYCDFALWTFLLFCRASVFSTVSCYDSLARCSLCWIVILCTLDWYCWLYMHYFVQCTLCCIAVSCALALRQQSVHRVVQAAAERVLAETTRQSQQRQELKVLLMARPISVLCTVYCVLCTVYCVLCTVYCIPCAVYCVLYCTVYCALCTV